MEIGDMDLRVHPRDLSKPLRGLEISELRVRLLEASRCITLTEDESRPICRRVPRSIVDECEIKSIAVSGDQMELHLYGVVELTLRMPLEEHVLEYFSGLRGGGVKIWVEAGIPDP